MNEEILEELKKRQANLIESIAKMKGVVEFDREKLRDEERLLVELQGRLSEVQGLFNKIKKEET